MTISFHVFGDPKPQPRPRAFARNMGGGKFAARVYDAGTAEGWKSCVALAAKPHLPIAPLDCPLFVDINFFLTRPKGHFNSKGLPRPSSPTYPLNKMDCDNLAKAVLDCLTQIRMWEDDGQIIMLTITKAYAAAGFPGARVQICGVEEMSEPVTTP